ncbi:MAG TPA: hypothetical protein VMW72_16330 [Sedimentisphaerales bacterium]|nr:hypothetical protein [Sedimentisphaerales bacterium]
MSVTLDGQNLFDEQQLEIEQDSLNRDSIEKAVAGLDGMLSIDMGGRARKIRQRGTLRAQSRTQMNARINAISAYMDGNTHTLLSSDGEKFENLRMDSFKVSEERPGGNGIAVDYEIVYTQLV